MLSVVLGSLSSELAPSSCSDETFATDVVGVADAKPRATPFSFDIDGRIKGLIAHVCVLNSSSPFPLLASGST